MQIIPIASGKGGVGKSLLSANLAIALGQAGKKVILADLDLGASNLHRVNLLNKKRNDAVAEYKSLNKKSDKLVEVAEFHSLNGGADKEVAVGIKELFNDIRNTGSDIFIALRTRLTVTGSDESVHISDNAVELLGSSRIFGGSSYGSLGDIV